jgi:multiple sugar transport system substrate-binding protein
LLRKPIGTITTLLLLLGSASVMAARTTITYIGGPHGEQMTNALSHFAQEFEATSNIHVDIQTVPSAGYLDRVTTMVLAGTAPDVTHLVGMETAAFAQRGWLENLKPYLDRERLDINSLLIPPVGEAITWDGGVYVMPLAAQTREIYFNVDLFAERGVEDPLALQRQGRWTWETMLNAAKRLTVYGDGRTVKQAGIWTSATYQNWYIYVWQAGGALFDRDVFPRRATIDTEQARQGLEFFSSLWNEHKVVPSYGERSGHGFTLGKAAMSVVDGPFYIATLRASNPSFEWDIASVPTGPANNLREVGFNNLQILKDSKHKAEAWEFVRYVALSPDRIRLLSAATGRPPALRRAIPYYIESVGPKPSNARQFVDGIVNARQTLVSEHLNAIYGVINPILRQVVDGNRAIPGALVEMEQRTNALLQSSVQ